MTTLNDRLITAHATGDHWALVGLYSEAADQADRLDSACFFLTHAYIFALELNHPDQQDLHDRLRGHGRV